MQNIPGARFDRIHSTSLSAHSSVSLDFMRGLASVLVMIGHLRGLFFVGYQDVSDQSFLVAAIYFLTSLGREAVIVFFVLSGYFISYSALNAYQKGRWSWKWYLSRRVTRLYVVFIPGLLLGLLIDNFGLGLFGPEGPYGAIPEYRHIIPEAVELRLGSGILLGNALFLQGIFVPSYGSNGALWSLSYEFWYYMLFPLLFISIAARATLAVRLSSLVASLAIFAFIGSTMSIYFTIWLMGVAVLLLPKPGIFSRDYRWWVSFLGLAGLLFSLSLVVAKVRLFDVFLSDFFVGLTFSFFVYLILHRPKKIGNDQVGNLGARVSKYLANISYTLYVVHVPALIFLQAWLVASGGGRWQPDLLHIAAGVLIAASMLAYATLVAFATEWRTDLVRRKLFG